MYPVKPATSSLSSSSGNLRIGHATVPIQVAVFWCFGLYRGVFASLLDLVRVAKTVLTGSVAEVEQGVVEIDVRDVSQG